MAGYLGASPVPQSILKKESKTLTANQTTVNTSGYTHGGSISVTLNGVLLEGAGVDYTATNGSDIVLTAGATAGDILHFQAFNEFTLVGQELTTPTINDATLKSNVTLKNDTHEDSDGGRASKIIYQGEQSGGEITTLAEIQASHDGTADDQKGDLIFRTNDGSDGTSPTTAMVIDSAQNVGIKTTLPVAPLHVDSDNGFGNILLSRDGGAGGRRPFGIGITGAADNDLTISASADTDQAGAFEGDRKEIVRFLAGGGMTFNGDTAAANALDDYEEGAWTAALDGITIASQVCRYIKVGTLVHVGAQIAIPVTGSGNNAMIGGFPFTTLNSDASRAGIVVSWHNVPSSNGLQFLLSDNATNGFFYIGSSIKSYANMTGATVYFGGTYIAA